MGLLIGTRNVTTQNVVTNGNVELGSVYRRYCKRINGTRTFDFIGEDVILQQNGIYHVTVTAVVSAATAGNVTLSLYENGVAVPSAFATETITTPNTELRTLVIDYFALVDTTCVLGCNSTVAKELSLVNTGIDATYTSVTMNVEKVV